MANIQLNPRWIYKYINNGVKKNCVYIGDIGSNKIIVGEIGQPDPNRNFVIIPSMNDVLFLDSYLIFKENNILSNLYLKGKPIKIDAVLFTKLINSIINNLINNYSNECLQTMFNNFLPSTNTLNDNSLPENMLRYIFWNIKKKKLKFDILNVLPHIMKNCVYFAYLGNNIGSEIDKLRPVLIWKEHINSNNNLCNSYFVFPISSKLKCKKYYYNVPITINGQLNIVKINDGRRIDIRRINKPVIDENTNKTYKILDQDIDNIKNAIKKYFQI